MTTTDNPEGLSDLDIFSEDVTAASDDAHEPQGFAPIAPGKYISVARQLVVNHQKSQEKGYPYVDIKFDLFKKEDGTEENRFPPFENITTKLFNARGSGQTSSVNRYLAAFGIEGKGLRGKALLEALKSTENMPVFVRIRWEDDFRERPQGQQAKPQSFFEKTGADGKKYFVHEVRDPQSGVVIKARAKVAGYDRYQA